MNKPMSKQDNQPVNNSAVATDVSLKDLPVAELMKRVDTSDSGLTGEEARRRSLRARRPPDPGPGRPGGESAGGEAAEEAGWAVLCGEVVA